MSENPYAARPPAPLSAEDDRQWATLAHVGGVLGFLPSLIIHLVFRHRGTVTRRESAEAFNWQIAWTSAAIALALIVAVVGAIIRFTIGYGLVYELVSILLNLVALAPYAVNLVLSIVGAVRVSGGGGYRYPVSLGLIR
jgi:uncharacterized protein